MVHHLDNKEQHPTDTPRCKVKLQNQRDQENVWTSEEVVREIKKKVLTDCSSNIATD
jgi:hypothetical protein